MKFVDFFVGVFRLGRDPLSQHLSDPMVEPLEIRAADDKDESASLPDSCVSAEFQNYDPEMFRTHTLAYLAFAYCLVPFQANARLDETTQQDLEEVADSKIRIDLRSGPAEERLVEFGNAVGKPVVFLMRHVEGVSLNAVSGDFTLEEAIDALVDETRIDILSDLSTGALVVVLRSSPAFGRVGVVEGSTKPNEPETTQTMPLTSNKKKKWLPRALASLSAVVIVGAQAQDDSDDLDEVYELSPFSVTAAEDVGYRATSTLAGSRIKTNIHDLGASISVATKEFLEDTGATDGESLLSYIGNAEVGGVLGNFSNSNTNSFSTEESRVNPQRAQRIRGLVSATLTRDYFQTDLPFDDYNTSRVTVNRGPNSILFGLGSPGGVINNSTNRASLGSNFGKASVRIDGQGGHRETIDLNRQIIEDRLALRFSILNEDLKFRQDPAFEEDRRFYGAWEWKLFSNEGSNTFGSTTFRGNVETGEIFRNPPDVVAPIDGFSSWWNGVGSQEEFNRILSVPGVTLDGFRTGAITSQMVLNAIDAGLVSVPEGMTAQEYAEAEGKFIPKTTITRFPTSDPDRPGTANVVADIPYFIFPSINFDDVNASPGFDDPALAGIDGIMGRWRPRGLPRHDTRWSYSLYETSPLRGLGFNQQSMSNRSVFDYHKNLLQGSTNYVETEFDIYQLVLEQEFFKGNAGLEIAFDSQSIDRERFLPFSGGEPKTINIDITEEHGPADSDGDGVPDRLFNENLGRPVIVWQDNTTTWSTADQETIRATVFGNLDFEERFESGWARWLGSHSLTGLYEDRQNDTWSRSTRPYWWADQGKSPGDRAISNGLSDHFRLNVRSSVYLGADARGLSSPDELRIDGGVNVRLPKIGDTYNIWYFDNSEKADVQNTWRLAENIVNGNVGRIELESKAYSLQSRFFNDHLITMFASRTDEQTVYQRLQHNTTYGNPSEPGVIPLRIDLEGENEVDGTFNEGLLRFLPDPASVDEDSTTTWSIVARFPEDLLFELPLGMDLRAHYYEAESFEPAGLSNNVLGQPLQSPFGETKEYGVTATFLEDRFSIRANFFETSNANDRTGSMNGQLGRIAGLFDLYIRRIIDTENDPEVDLFPSEADSLLTPDTVPSNSARTSGTDADIGGFGSWEDYYAALIAAAPERVQAAYNFRTEIREDGSRFASRNAIPGLNSTRDFVAEGVEIDVTGQLTENWSVFFNIARQETITTNTGPIAIPLAFEIYERLQQPLASSPGGWSLAQLRVAPSLGGPSLLIGEYEEVIREMRLQSGLDGTVSQEQRKWRANLFTRYAFHEGALRGFTFGGGLRYQDEISAGYPNRFDEFGNVLPDLDNPFFGPDELNGDAFVSYQKRLADKVDWKIQLNARNLYRSNGNDDIPVTFNPDGSISVRRIPTEQQYFLTNTFSF